VCGGTAPNLCSCAWTSESVATGPAYLDEASMVLDAQHAPQILFWKQDQSSGTGELTHATKVNGSWVQTTVATAVNSYYSNVAIDGAGDLHSVFGCKHYLFSGGAWTSPDSYCAPNDRSLAAAIAVAADGTLHVAYLGNDNTTAVQYATRANNKWSFETIEANGPTYTTWDDGIAIGLLPGDVPAVAYPGATAIHYASRTNGTWTVEPVFTFGGYTGMSMEISASGVVRLDYLVGYGQQQLAVRENGAWTTTPLSGFGVLPNGFPMAPVIAEIDYTGLNNPNPLVLLSEGAGGSFTRETLKADVGNGTGIDAAIVDGSGVNGTIWVLTGGYQSLTLYHRCAFP
jgi:hypothetical protein